MKSCLIVDDSKVIRKVARHILETMDFDVAEAADGKDALDQVADMTPDVILLDWNMPIMSGMDFLRAYRSTSGSDAKVIFCTTENGIGHIQAAIDAGADEYVMKPFDRETLESKLQIVGCI
jgi:two-component system chemotaxis response regulator CheY|nr:response regulator [uncultured Sphingorhabdus sp.]